LLLVDAEELLEGEPKHDDDDDRCRREQGPVRPIRRNEVKPVGKEIEKSIPNPCREFVGMQLSICR
jgi:hypothetical protein